MRYPATVLGLVLCALLAACGGGAAAGASGLLTIEPAQLPGGISGNLYSATLVASGGAGRGYAWALVSGSLPAGVEGVPGTGGVARLSGTLGAPGTYVFAVRLVDADGASATKSYTVVVAPAGGGGGGATRTSDQNAPGPREGHTAVWTGTEMVVWGGFRQTGPLQDGGAYDPATDTWRAVSTLNAPSPRFAHSAVWTGTEMIVFGGWDGQGILGTGAAWNAATDTWRPLPAANAPAARTLHTAVWTGAAMLVWGGQGVFPPPAPNSVDLVFADGASYDPTTNQWTAIPAGGPAMRSHSAVWSGAEMIVWGGRDAFALTLQTLDIGGWHDPVGGGWTATSGVGVPPARQNHSAVWAGPNGMIVWGGLGGLTAALATGGRYAPGPNAWAATAIAGAPTGRYDHTAVWTGAEMVVWGGSTLGGGLSANGAAYRPAANTWRPVIAGLVTAPRAGHTAVWTGAAMIVWGGRTTPADVHLNTGFVLAP